MKKWWHLVLLLFPHSFLFAEDPVRDSLITLIEHAEADSNKVMLLLELSDHLRASDLTSAIEKSNEALTLVKEIGYTRGKALTYKSLGLSYYFLGDYSEALMQWKLAKTAYEEIPDVKGEANMLSNMGAIYHSQSEYGKAIELYLQALKIAEEAGDTMRIGTVLQNIGAVHLDKGSYDLALDAYQKVLPLFETIGYEEGVGLAYLNCSEAFQAKNAMAQSIEYGEKAVNYLKQSPYYPTALRTLGTYKLSASGFREGLEFLDSAYAVAYRSGDNAELPRVINAIASCYQERGQKQEALVWFEKGKSMLQGSDLTNLELKDAARGLVDLYAWRGDYKNAFDNQKILQMVTDSIYNLESDKKIDHLLFGFEMDKKENEIALLVKDTEIKSIEVKRQKGIRNGFMAGFLLVLVFAGTFLVQRNQITKGKRRSDALLLNILPHEVAEELKQTGHAEARDFELVSILFTDFKDFTHHSAKLSARDLVTEINDCFEAFDRIMERYGIEKIKTIGDAYMAAGGLPVPFEGSVKNTILAALDMQDFIAARNVRQLQRGLPFFEMRLGIHTGPVVAGIVGVKKFQYDIWGDTVNTASRMESYGEVGKTNISQSTYALVKNEADFIFERRSKIDVKGKGDMEMYFVKRAGEMA